MSYRLYSFEPLDGSGAVALPEYNATDDVSPSEPKYNWVNTYDGFYDYLGNSRARLNGQTITKSATLHSFSASQLVAYYDQLRSLVGKKGKLYARMQDDTIRWKYARFYVSGTVDNITYNRCNLDLNMSFEIPDVAWKSNDLNTVYNGLSGLTNVTIANNGNYDINNSIITISNPSQLTENVTSVRVKNPGLTEFTWSGSLSPGNDLVIDTGARSIKINSNSEYNSFVLTNNHITNTWLTLQPGNNSLEIEINLTPLTISYDLPNVTGYITGVTGPPTFSNSINNINQIYAKVEYYDMWV